MLMILPEFVQNTCLSSKHSVNDLSGGRVKKECAPASSLMQAIMARSADSQISFSVMTTPEVADWATGDGCEAEDGDATTTQLGIPAACTATDVVPALPSAVIMLSVSVTVVLARQPFSGKEPCKKSINMCHLCTHFAITKLPRTEDRHPAQLNPLATRNSLQRVLHSPCWSRWTAAAASSTTAAALLPPLSVESCQVTKTEEKITTLEVLPVESWSKALRENKNVEDSFW
jgi:hypothetical protein